MDRCSEASLGSTIATLEGKMGMSPLIVRLLAPIGSVLNLDGVVIYSTINIIFFAQKHNYEIGLFDILITRRVVHTLHIRNRTSPYTISCGLASGDKRSLNLLGRDV